jgi:hypothetical protein
MGPAFHLAPALALGFVRFDPLVSGEVVAGSETRIRSAAQAIATARLRAKELRAAAHAIAQFTQWCV